MRKIKISIGTVAFAVFSAVLCADGQAAEHNWTLVKEKLYPKSQLHVNFYVDTETLKRKGNSVWLDGMDDVRQPDGKVYSWVHHYEFKCGTTKVKHSVDVYNGVSMARGEPNHRLRVSQLNFEPDGFAAVFYEYSCRRQ